MPDSSSRISRRSYILASATAAAATQLLGPKILEAAAQDRIGKLRLLTESPLNAEAKLSELLSDYLTPLDTFYIRTNGTVPLAHEDDHRITIEGMVSRPAVMSLLEMRKLFGETELNAVLMCAGNRRTEMSAVKKVSGTPWTTGAIGNAKWRGINLASVLNHVGVSPEAKYVWFESIDRCAKKDGTETAFGASIPLDKALDGSTILAQSMNGAPLTPDHGAPVRVIVPGYIGSRSVKWVGKIIVSDKPSPNYFVSENYKFVADTKPESLAAAEPINEYTINSLICDPEPGATVSAGEVTLRGIALPRGGRLDRIAKVEILAKDNTVLAEAKLHSPGEAFCWEMWSATVKLPPGEHTLGVRAHGTQGDSQPLEPNWNAMGYLYNAPHWVTFQVK